MGLRATTNADEVITKLDAFMASVVNVAAPRALNKLRDQARTAGMREAARIYGIPVRKLNDAKFVTLTDARQGDLASIITVKGAGFPLFLFSPSPSSPNPRRKGTGVTVTIKGHRITIPHAFIARMKSGHVGVFSRGAYGGKSSGLKGTGEAFGRFQFGRSRLPINELYTFSPPDAFGNDEVTEAMNKRVAEQTETVFAQEVAFASR